TSIGILSIRCFFAARYWGTEHTPSLLESKKAVMNIVRKFTASVLRFAKRHKSLNSIPIDRMQPTGGTAVDAYWAGHTVCALPFQSAQESLAYLEWRFEQYPLFREFMQLYGQRDSQVVLDYGCGPGNDLVGFLVH